MEPNTLLTGLQELFTNAVKAEVEKHVAANGNGDINMDDVQSQINSAVEETMNDYSVDFSDFDISDHVDVDDLVSCAVGDMDLSDAITDTLSNYDYPDENRVEEMIGESSSRGLSMSAANGYFDQVANGDDCSDGESFRNAVLSIMNADKVKNGMSVDDGTAMSVKATGTDHEVQAILKRRRNYFEELHSRLSYLLGSAPNGNLPPVSTVDDGEAMQAWKDERAANHPTPSKEDQLANLWYVAKEATKLLGLLSGLYNGLSGQEAVRAAGAWENVAQSAWNKSKEDAND